MTVLLANNVSSALAAPITASATSMTVTNGSRFPVLTPGQYFYATIIATNGIVEIVKVNTRNGNAMSITRAQDGTNAQAFASGARVEMRINAASVRDTVTDQTGPLDTRLTTAEGDITSLEGRMTTAEGDITTIEGDIVALEAFDTALATSTGSASVGFLQAGTGASLRTVQSKLRDFVSVKDFGAVGDGVTDDSAAFVALLNSNPSSPGFDVFIPAGTYKINSAALYFTRRIRFFGNSRETTILDFSQSNSVVNAPYKAHIIFVHSNNIAGTSTFANPITLPLGWVGNYGELGGLFDLTVKCNPSVIGGNGVFFNVAANSNNILVRDANLHNIVVAAAATNLQTRGGAVGPSGVDIGGNSNNGVYINLKAQYAVNGDGIHINGSDGNANLFLHPDASFNKGWGVNDASSLGNTFSQGHTSDNLYGAYRSRPASANRATFLSPYAEGGQGTDNLNTIYEMSARAIIVGAQGATPDGNFPAITGENDGLVARATVSVMDAADTEDTGGTFGRVGRGLLSMRTTDGLLLELKRESSAYTGLFYGANTPVLFNNTSNGAIDNTKPYFPNGFALNPNSSQNAAAAAPTTGSWVRGQIVWNISPSAGGFAGWICTTGGTPGTWRTFGAIS